MKKIFVSIAVTLLASAALACPDLSGTYMCMTDNGDGQGPQEVEFIVSQKVVNGVTVYTTTDVDGSFDLIADGQKRTKVSEDSDSEMIFNISETATCLQKSALQVNIEMVVTDKSGQVLGEGKSDSLVSKTAEGLRYEWTEYDENGNPTKDIETCRNK